jgi:hypothetical protein
MRNPAREIRRVTLFFSTEVDPCLPGQILSCKQERLYPGKRVQRLFPCRVLEKGAKHTPHRLREAEKASLP